MNKKTRAALGKVSTAQKVYGVNERNSMFLPEDLEESLFYKTLEGGLPKEQAIYPDSELAKGFHYGVLVTTILLDFKKLKAKAVRKEVYCVFWFIYFAAVSTYDAYYHQTVWALFAFVIAVLCMVDLNRATKARRGIQRDIDTVFPPRTK